MTPARIVLASTLLLYCAFHFWYGGSSEPLTTGEADTLIAEIRAGMESIGGHPDEELLESFRVLTREDDGREFYMLNLMRFREKALYPEGSGYDDDALAAAQRYNEAVVPALLARGSLPILLGEYAGAFIPPHPEANEGDWDQIGIVRYRSRRDMLEMARALSRSGDGIHKWASLERTVVFPVAPVFDFVFVRGAVFLLLFITGGTTAYVLRRRPN